LPGSPKVEFFSSNGGGGLETVSADTLRLNFAFIQPEDFAGLSINFDPANQGLPGHGFASEAGVRAEIQPVLKA